MIYFKLCPYIAIGRHTSPLDFQVRRSRFWGDIVMVKFYFRFVHPMINRLFLSKSLWKFTDELFFMVSVCLPSSNVIQYQFFWHSCLSLLFYFSLVLSFNISIVSDPIVLKLGWCIVTRKYRSPIYFQDRTVKVKVTRRQNNKILNSWFLCRFWFDLLQTLPLYSNRATDKHSWFSGLQVKVLRRYSDDKILLSVCISND